MPDLKEDFVNKIREAKTDDLHAMKIHESMQLTNFIFVLRVPGGWIYCYPHTSCFVPYKEEKDA
jgi:hypothetical protein